MALIQNSKGRRDNQTPSGYTRLFGEPDLGRLMSRVQGTVIAAGTELEHLIIDQCRHIPDLDRFITDRLHDNEPGVWVATKKQVKQSTKIISQHEPDFIAFSLDKRICYVVEVKDGDQFDTKKASGEHASLKAFANDASAVLPFSMQLYLCSFNASDIEEIYHGLKRKFSKDELLTGRALCALFEIDYESIIKTRISDQAANLEYFLDRLVDIPLIRYALEKSLRDKSPSE